MKRNLIVALSALGLLTTACGPETEFEAEDKLAAVQATTAGKAIVDAAQTIGLLPKWSCGKPEKEAMLGLRPRLDEALGHCARIDDNLSNATGDGLEVTFPTAGCQVGKATWTGGLGLAYSTGDDRNEVSLDLHSLAIDGHPVDGRVGYLSCGDLTVYEAAIRVKVPFNKGVAPLGVAFDGTVTDRPGLPLIGTDFYVIDGPATVEVDHQTVKVAFHQVFWEPGGNVPAKGSIVVTKPDGRTLTITFDAEHHLASVQANGDKPIPLPQP